MTQAFFGFDVGTSSSKAVLVDASGQVLASSSIRHSVTRGERGLVEMDMDIWWQEFKALYARLVAGRGVQVAGIGVSGMGPCVGVTDLNHRPLAPAALYGIDWRAREEIEEMTARYGQDSLLAECDSVLTSQAGGPKVAWFRKRFEDAFSRGVRFFMPHSWLVWKLTGEYTLDRHSASQMTPLYSPASGVWDEARVEELAGGAFELPRLGWSHELAGQTRACSDLPELEAGIPLIFGTIDAWAEQESVGATGPGDLFLMYGTTLFLIANAGQRMRHASMWGTTGTRAGTYNLAGGLATSGALTDWFRGISGEQDFGLLLQEAEAAGPGARGLLALPYFAGERTPIQDPDARGVLLGLSLEHGRGHIYRALLEGTAFAVRHNLETMQDAGAEVTRVTCAGGGVQSLLWPQIISDVTGRPQLLRRHTIGASLGDAFMVAQALGFVGDIGEWNPVERVIEPRDIPLYEQFYADYRELYRATASIQHRMAQVQND